MANEREYQGVQIGGRVPQRYLGKRDLSGLQHYIDVRNQRWDEAIKQKSAIDVALGQLKLNSAEDQWKYEYGKKIQKRIDDAAQFGDYSTALDTAILEAGKAISSPEVIGRIRANESYEKAKQEVDARNDIGAATKEAWRLSNKYHYEDTYDDDGNIVGGTDWTNAWKPVSEVDNLAKMREYISAIGISEKNVSKTIGDNTTNADGTGSGYEKQKAYSHSALPYDKIKSQLIDAIDNDVNWKASLEQEDNVNRILLDDINNKLRNTTSPSEIAELERKKQMYTNNITNEGGFVTANYVDILFKKYPNLIKNFAYSRDSYQKLDKSVEDNYMSNSGGSNSGGGKYNVGKLDATGDDTVWGSQGKPN